MLAVILEAEADSWQVVDDEEIKFGIKILKTYEIFPYYINIIYKHESGSMFFPLFILFSIFSFFFQINGEKEKRKPSVISNVGKVKTKSRVHFLAIFGNFSHFFLVRKISSKFIEPKVLYVRCLTRL